MKSVLLLSLGLMNFAHAIPPTMTIVCDGKIHLDIDIYTSGHPMSGARRYTGLTSFDGVNISHLKTGIWEKGIYLYGNGHSLESYTYELKFTGNPYFEPDLIFPTEFIVTKKQPISADTVERSIIDCKRTL